MIRPGRRRADASKGKTLPGSDRGPRVRTYVNRHLKKAEQQQERAYNKGDRKGYAKATKEVRHWSKMTDVLKHAANFPAAKVFTKTGRLKKGWS